jgi:DNA-binding GntR family transcriptional regulator
LSTRTGIPPIVTAGQSLVERVSHAVRRAILEGRLRPGDTLSISDLAADLGVSHSPVREALQQLAGQGLVVLRPARTAVVASLGIPALTDIYRLRTLIEADAGARAARLLTDEHLVIIEREFTELTDAPVDSEHFWTSHNAFHSAIMEPVTTPRLERIVAELWQSAERYIRIVYGETDVLFTLSAQDRHRPLLEAAKARSASKMRKALTQHLQTNEQEITRSLEQIAARQPPGEE